MEIARADTLTGVGKVWLQLTPLTSRSRLNVDSRCLLFQRSTLVIAVEDDDVTASKSTRATMVGSVSGEDVARSFSGRQAAGVGSEAWTQQLGNGPRPLRSQPRTIKPHPTG